MASPDPHREPGQEPINGYNPDIVPRQPREPSPDPIPDDEPVGPVGGVVEGSSLPSYARPERTSGLAIVSLVLGIVGIFIIPIIISAIAVLVGWGAIVRIDRDPAMAGRGLAIAGIILGFVGLIIGILAVVIAASYDWFVLFLY